jgi:hypothetical protein
MLKREKAAIAGVIILEELNSYLGWVDLLNHLPSI